MVFVELLSFKWTRSQWLTIWTFYWREKKKEKIFIVNIFRRDIWNRDTTVTNDTRMHIVLLCDMLYCSVITDIFMTTISVNISIIVCLYYVLITELLRLPWGRCEVSTKSSVVLLFVLELAMYYITISLKTKVTKMA